MEPIFETFDSLFENPQEIPQNQFPILEKAIPNPSSTHSNKNLSNLKPPPNLAKLKPLSSCKKNIVLLLYGSFYPLHNNHLRALQISKEYIETSHDLNKIYHVMGCYLMPTHLNSLKKKLGKPLLDNETRLALYEKAVEDHEFLSIVPFLSLQKTNIGIHKSKKFLSDYLNASLMQGKKRSQKIAVVSVLGDDTLEIIEKNLQKRELTIIVQNRPHQTNNDLNLWLNSEKISPFKENLIVVIDEKIPFETSSTEIRRLMSSSDPTDHLKLKTLLPSKMYNFMLEKQIKFPTPSLNNTSRNDEELDVILKEEKASLFEEKLILPNLEISMEEIRNLSNNPNNFSKLKNSLPPKIFQLIATNKMVFPIIKKSSIEPLRPKVNLDELVGMKVPEIAFSSLSIPKNPQKLGEGLQASVHSMLWRKNEFESIPVAVKITDLTTNGGRKLKYFTRDLKALLLCNHKNVVKCFGAGIEGNKMFTVMERGLGLNTWNFIQEQRKTWEKKSIMPRKWFKYLAELAEGLQTMSDAGVLHRDLQMNNIVVFEREEKKQCETEEKKENDVLDYKIEEFQLKICDFGVSALESDKHAIVRGSLRHYAPEAMEDKLNYVTASDVYSFGNLMYEIVNARKTFTEYMVEEMMVKVKMGERPRFQKGSDLRLSGVIEKCWVHDWKKRPSFLEVAREIRKIYEDAEEK